MRIAVGGLRAVSMQFAGDWRAVVRWRFVGGLRADCD